MGATVAFNERDGMTGLLEQISRGDAGDAGANDGDVHFEVPVQLRKSRQRRRVDPVGSGVHR